MKTQMRWFLAMLLALMGAATVVAQPPPQRYVHFKIDAEYEKELKKRLEMEQRLGPLKDLINQIIADPSKLPNAAEQLKGLKLEDEKFKEALKDWVSKDPSMQKALREWAAQKAMDQSPEELLRLQAQMKDLLKEAKPPEVGGPAEPPVLPPGTVPIEPSKQKTESFAKITERAMKDAESSRFGEWLKESNAWRRALTDIRASLGDANAPRWQIEGWQQDWLQQDTRLWNLGKGAFERLRDLPRANVLVPGLDNVAIPGVPAPALPNLGENAMPALGTAAVWLLLSGLALLACWQLMQWTRRATPAADPRVLLGPWPVAPATVATRRELVLAFDYLALLTLGLDAECWNHHVVVRRWREQSPPCEGHARILESLYESARYTEGAETLNDADRDRARQALTQLAEAL